MNSQSGHQNYQLSDGIHAYTVVGGANQGVGIWAIDAGATVCIDWMALYEGAYTVDTLPEYQSKGYGAELLECQRYYCNSWNAYTDGKNAAHQIYGSPYIDTSADFWIYFPREMRLTPTMKYYGTAGRDKPYVYTSRYVEGGSVINVFRLGKSGVYTRVGKAETDTTTWIVGNCIAFHAHWEACADML